MSLAHGRPYLAIPGPSVVPDRVLQAMHRPSPNIYTGELVDMMDGLLADLKAVARTRHQVALYIANGHGVWEAALANTVEEGETVLVLATGDFAIGWGHVAAGLGANVETLDFGRQSDFDLDRVAEYLAADTARRIKAVLCVQVDTSTSIKNDIPGLRGVLDATGHPALLMVDCIASLGVDRMEMDDWGVDLVVTGSQKGLMTPPGMGFVYFNDKAAEARAGLKKPVSVYWDWVLRTRPDWFYQYFCGTAPTHHLYGLREALTMLVHEEGVEAAWARHEKLARAIWAAFEAWETAGGLTLNIADPAKRSHAVTSARAPGVRGTELREWLEFRTGVTLGIGLGMAEPDDPVWHSYFRVGHMGHVNTHMVMGTLGAIEAGLRALDIPHGPGALDAAAQVVSEA